MSKNRGQTVGLFVLDNGEGTPSIDVIAISDATGLGRELGRFTSTNEANRAADRLARGTIMEAQTKFGVNGANAVLADVRAYRAVARGVARNLGL